MSERTFKLIYHSTAVQLYELGHPIYIIWEAQHIIKQCYVHPNNVLVNNPIYYITTELHNKLMNKRTPQQAFIDSKPAQEAWLAGKPLQHKHVTCEKYNDFIPSSDLDIPYFLDPSFHWRPKPEPEKVPFNQQTIPADAWFRKRGGMAMYRPNVITFDGISLNGTMYFYSKLASDFEYSTDRINWQPCYTLKTT